MSRPTLSALQHLRKLIGFLKHEGDLGIKLSSPSPGAGKWKTTQDQKWILETFSDADWMGNRAHRKSTSSGVHLLNGCFLYASSRTQKVISLSSCESELHAIVSSMSDAIFIRRCLQFMLDMDVLQVQCTDSRMCCKFNLQTAVQRANCYQDKALVRYGILVARYYGCKRKHKLEKFWWCKCLQASTLGILVQNPYLASVYLL